MLRLPNKHSKKDRPKRAPADGRRLLAEQSLLRGTLGSVGVALLLCWTWALASLSLGRVFPWFSIVMGALIGLAMQRFGRGLDWRFPVVALLLAALSAYAGKLMIGVVETGRYIEASPLEVLGGLSSDTMRVFFRNIIGPVDHIFAFSAAGVAAYYANRRLQRHEVLGLRTMKKEERP